MKLCETCEKRNRCKTLCRQAEEYVSQDYVCQEELTIPYIDNFDKMIDYALNKYTKKTIINLHKDGMSVNDIAYHIPHSKQYIRRIIQKYKEDLC